MLRSAHRSADDIPRGESVVRYADSRSRMGRRGEVMSFCFVRVETDDGTIGYGEACDSFGCSYVSVLATIVSDVYAPLQIGAPADSVSAIAE